MQDARRSFIPKFIAELRRPTRPPSRDPYSYRKEKETHELINSELSCVMLFLVGAWVQQSFTMFSDFYECLYNYEPFLQVRHIVTILSHFNECVTFIPFWVNVTSAARFFNFEPFLRMRHISTILSHLCECDTFLPFWAFFTSAAHFYHF